MDSHFALGILGAGFSGKILASKLLSNAEFSAKTKIYLIDRSFVNGMAYGTPDSEHLLNVRASNMSAFADKPTHFVEYLNEQFGDSAWASRFVSRKVYSDYIDAIFATAKALAPNSLQEISEEVRSVSTNNGRLEVLVDNQTILLDHLVLAYGNIHLDSIPTAAGPVKAKAAWPFDRQALSKNKILFVGTSLTMVDLALSAARLNPQSKLFAVSRNGLLPAVHAVTDPKQIQEIRDIFETQFGTELVSLKELFSFVRSLSTMHSWREVVDALRPNTIRLWSGFSLKEKQTFNRRLSTFWSVHRHRVSPEVNSPLQELIATGRLEILPGIILATSQSNSGFDVTINERNGETLQLQVDEIINCTGPATAKQLRSHQFISSLLEENLITLDPTGVGLSLADSLDSEVLFTKQISSLGPPIRGELLECTSVPELRGQVARLANLLQSHTSN